MANQTQIARLAGDLESVSAEFGALAAELRNANGDGAALDLAPLQARVARLQRALGISSARPEISIEGGKPVLLGSLVHYTELQDCSDAQAIERRLVHVRKVLPEAQRPELHPVPSFQKRLIGTVIADAVIEQAHADPEPGYAHVWLGNAEPRSGGDSRARGNPFVAAVLPGANIYFGTSPDELSAFRNLIVNGKVWVLNLSIGDGIAKGLHDTVYRSRFLDKTARLWVERGDLAVFGDEISLDAIPEINPYTVRDADSFGNVRFNVNSRHPFFQELEPGVILEVTINGGKPVNIQYGKSLGTARKGESVIAPGSTKCDPLDPQPTFIEIYVNNGHANKEFATFDRNSGEVRPPQSGDPIEIVNHTTKRRLTAP